MSAAFDLEIVVRTVYGEARGESAEGKLAVCWVILNRWRSKKWFAGRTLAATCMKPKQFSCWNDGDPNREKMCDATDADLADCQAAAAEAIDGPAADPTEGCTHYHVVAMSPWPSWATGREPHRLIGAHAFYKDIA